MGNKRTRAQVVEDIKTQSKVCTTCGKREPFSEFLMVKRFPDSRGVHCRSCRSKIRGATKQVDTRTSEEVKDNIRTGTKVCGKCGNLKVMQGNFHKKSISTDGYASVCIECDRAYRTEKNKCFPLISREKNLINNYGITLEDYDNMLMDQNGICKICGTSDPGGRNDSNYFHVDHNHTTGKVRGLLCSGCNVALGHLQDNSILIRKAADYLDENN